MFQTTPNLMAPPVIVPGMMPPIMPGMMPPPALRGGPGMLPLPK